MSRDGWPYLRGGNGHSLGLRLCVLVLGIALGAGACGDTRTNEVASPQGEADSGFDDDLTEEEALARWSDVEDPGPTVSDVVGVDAELLGWIETIVPPEYERVSAQTFESDTGVSGSMAGFQRTDGSATLTITWQYLPPDRTEGQTIPPEGEAVVIPMGRNSERALFIRADGFQVGVQSKPWLTPDETRFASETGLETSVLEQLAREIALAYEG